MLFSVFLSAVLYQSRVDNIEGVNFVSRTDGRLFNLARLKAKTKVMKLCVRELLYAEDAALVETRLEKFKQKNVALL